MCTTAERIHAARLGMNHQGVFDEYASAVAGCARILDRIIERPDLKRPLRDPLETAVASYHAAHRRVTDLLQETHHAPY